MGPSLLSNVSLNRKTFILNHNCSRLSYPIRFFFLSLHPFLYFISSTIFYNGHEVDVFTADLLTIFKNYVGFTSALKSTTGINSYILYEGAVGIWLYYKRQNTLQFPTEYVYLAYPFHL